MQRRNVKRLSIAGFLLFIVTAVGPCTLTHKFGPYYGRVVDRATSETIDGAVIVITFNTILMTPAGDVYKFVDAIEVITDYKGEFYIEPYRAWMYRLLSFWDKNCGVTVFKPGFGVYPYNANIKDVYFPNYSVPSGEYLTIKLSKLDTNAERKSNLSYVRPTSIPDDKIKKLLELISLERKTLGFH